MDPLDDEPASLCPIIRGPKPALKPAKRRKPRWTPMFAYAPTGEPCDLIHIEDRRSGRIALIEAPSGERRRVPLDDLRTFRE